MRLPLEAVANVSRNAAHTLLNPARKRVIAKGQYAASQRSLQSAPIFRLLLKVAVMRDALM